MKRTALALATAMTLLATLIGGCSRPSAPTASEPGAGDAAFRQLAGEILGEYYQRNPTTATDLGIHTYDDKLEDYSAAAVQANVAAAKGFRTRLDAIDPARLTPDAKLDREFLQHIMDGSVLRDDVVRGWTKDPDLYSSGITNTAYVMIKRNFAPPEQRLKSLVARLKSMPNVLADARRNLVDPPKVYTEIAIEQVDGNRDFFTTSVAEAFREVTDAALLADFRTANAAVVAALDEYKRWLQNDLLPKSNGSFAYGADTYQKVLAADELVTTPLPELLAIAQADLERNRRAFVETARKVDPSKSPEQVMADMAKDHPPADQLLSKTQGELDALAVFIKDRRIVTVPPAPPARVKETPPFLAATTSASMDIPGPFEKVATEAYFNMTLPDPSWPKEEQDDFMTQWYFPAISNVSVHEVWPGHYLQFLYAKDYPSDVRKVFGAASNSEGWAHYSEQMMIDEGFHSDDPRYRLAQLQDALLRDVRFVVGIKMHTQGMTVAQAKDMFAHDSYQPDAVAESEAKRGTADATYGYYTMGKLMILKLRDDYRSKVGDAYTLEGFHDAFVKMGPLPLPLIRKAMLGATGNLF
ncbi:MULTISPECIES: DUF885 domain-containing protein [unclassified Mycobacterium]|uniref:DUF885 domain-containing protein n=1 Tax=unclassified Mycobacterium TaxID=2642494 RepID=UPI0029C9638A|nr:MULTISPECIES: DUF885 domain-containing protein [unclassified Mycobacterium]